MSKELIVIPDRRFHQISDGSFVPRVTSITGMWPKGEGYERWLGDSVSYDAACEYRDATAASGTKIHEHIAALLQIKMEKGSVTLVKDNQYSLTEWKKLISFVQFMKDWKVRPVEVEKFLFSEFHDTAGTADLIAYVTDPKDKEQQEFLTVIDWKTGSAIHHGHEIQVMMYGQMHPESIFSGLIVRLGSQHKCGYEVRKTSDLMELLQDWKACHHLFIQENGRIPKPQSYPQSITL